MAYPWENGVLQIAIDGAQKVSAVAWAGVDKKTGNAIRGSFRSPDILDAAEVEAKLQAVAAKCSYTSVRAAVEYPRWNAGASQTVRAAANAYVRLLRRVFPGVVIEKVDPNVWQGKFGYRNRSAKQSTKEFSIFLAEQAYGWRVDGDHDRADAAMILEWLRQTPPAQPKPKKKKVSRKR